MDTDKILELTEKTLLDNVSLALVLASAMAWNEVIKVFAAKFIKSGSGGEWYVVMYAVFLSLLMVGFQVLSKRPTKKVISM